ncbi:unnamed protein product [marine sediment metagenome]|uniref:N-acetyltransferase domain-containing protein n=1 Tax=marine sediment metagenome TaxID=412755 RepID=X1I9V3_9ZZZZ
MIKQITDSKTFLDISDKLKEVRDCDLKQSSLYNYMVAGIYNKKIFTFASYDKDKMNGCLILTLIELSSDLCLNILFVWIDRHYPKLWEEYIEFIDKKAKEFRVRKIIGITKRSVKVIERKYGKYGYHKLYNVFVKEMI